MNTKNKQKEYDIIQAERHYPVVKHNNLIQQSRYKLTAQEQKVLFYLITKIKPEDTDFKEYEFNINRFCEVCGIDKNNGRNFEMLKKTIMDLINKSFWVNINGEYVSMNWIEKAKISQKKGTIKIRLDNDMKSYLLDLQKHFTSYNLYYILTMKSKYSIRLYELLKSYEYLGGYTFEIEELKKILDAEKYTTYKDFRVNVLDIALLEINNFSDINATYIAEKNGKKYETITFSISLKMNTIERAQTWRKIEERLNGDKN